MTGHWQKPAFILFLLAWGVNEALLCLGIQGSPATQAAEASLLLSALFSTLTTLARRLPVQNVGMAALLIAGMGALLTGVACLSGIPFGPCTHSENLGGKIFSVLPWPIPLIWVIVLINARGVARLVMRPWRKTNYYGFWVIGLTGLLAVLLDLSLEPFAVQVKKYWTWQTPGWVWAWYSAPWVNFLGWFASALIMVTFTTPWLINKQPVKQPMNYQPLLLWLLLNAWLITGNLKHQLWVATAVGITGAVATVLFTVRGARWQNE